MSTSFERTIRAARLKRKKRRHSPAKSSRDSLELPNNWTRDGLGSYRVYRVGRRKSRRAVPPRRTWRGWRTAAAAGRRLSASRRRGTAARRRPTTRSRGARIRRRGRTASPRDSRRGSASPPRTTPNPEHLNGNVCDDNGRQRTRPVRRARMITACRSANNKNVNYFAPVYARGASQSFIANTTLFVSFPRNGTSLL